MIKKFSVGGMSCSACSSGIEKAISRLSGINSVVVSLLAKEMTVDFNEQILTENVIVLTVEKLGYTVEKGGKTQDRYAEAKAMKTRFIVSLIILIPLMYLCLGGVIGLPTPKNAVNFIFQFVLATAVLIINKKFFINGTRAVFNRSPNMDTLVSLGSASAYVYSIVMTVFALTGREISHVFFDSSAMVVSLVTLGKWLEELSKIKTGDATAKLGSLIPKTATVIRNGVQLSVETENIMISDQVIIRAGEYISVDGEVIDGSGGVDKSAITGESMPEEITLGDKVTSGSILVEGYIVVRAEKVGGQTLFSQIIKIVQSAGASKAPIQKLADKISGVFVPIVTALALITFAIWLVVTGDLYRAFNFGISVLVVSCPCALGLATPVAVVTSTGKSATKGILFKNAESLQSAHKIDCVLLDKTATITVGKPKVTDYKNFTGESNLTVFPLISALEKKSSHPLAECVINFCGESQKQVENYQYVLGKGIIGEVDGVKYHLGNLSLMPKELNLEDLSNQYEGKTLLYFADDYQLVSIIALADYLKPDSREAIAELKDNGIKTVMITGDNDNSAKRIAEEAGLDEFVSDVLPQDKYEIVNKYKEQGYFVAMVGDGINDSPALKSADIGIAMGAGTDVAIDSAEIILSNGNLKGVLESIKISKRTMRVIKQNLFWAFFYNSVGIPLAGGALAVVGVTLTPVIASALMCVSSLFVVTNALRLSKKQKSEREKTLTKRVYVEKIMCMHCVDKVKTTLLKVDGVKSVAVDLKSKTATVIVGKKVTDLVILDALERIDYKGEII